MDQEALDLRPADEQALHAEDEHAQAGRPRRVRELYNPANRHDRRATWSAEADAKAGTGPDGRWRVYDYEDLVARDKASLDIFWLRDDSLADSDNLPAPAVIAREIIEDLEAALEQFRLIEADLASGSADRQ